YPTREAGGAVWAYMGDPETMPEMPLLEALTVPETHIRTFKREQEAYFMQCLEGDIDSSHVGFLHRDLLTEQAEGTNDSLNAVAEEFHELTKAVGEWQ